MADKYIAHKTEAGDEQSLKTHLENVAQLAEEYAVDEFKEYARLCGLMHDLGKYTQAFQNRINGTGPRTEHARYGAQELHKNKLNTYIPMLEYCIAGHHTGLCDGGSRSDLPDTPTLHGILKRDTEDYSAFQNEISYQLPEDTIKKMVICGNDREESIERYAFLTRYIYSCLTDADFIDTESFCAPDTKRGLPGDFAAAYDAVCRKLGAFVPETELQKARNKLQEQVYKSVEENKSIYIVDMPTGSGKTLCSIKAALKQALDEGKKRIIYVIPYVSIIEQTAEIFRSVFGDVLPVVEHHSNFDFDDKDVNENESEREKLKRSCENWDAPLIVTTNIQFFESLYHHKSSRLRKLHNLAQSVIVFDEIHMLPTQYIKPCMRAIGYITRYLHSTVLLMSATMPDYGHLLEKYADKDECVYAVKDKSCFDAFKKCRYSFIGEVSAEGLADKAMQCKNALIIVNKRETVRQIYNLCKDACEVYQLSTYITPEHRSRIISAIRDRLNRGERIIVISTSLIEAGVDLDFETVFRENAGLDNIIQSGGRCNREGRAKTGDVFVFETSAVTREIQLKANITRSLFNEFEDITSQECVREYYDRLFAVYDEEIEENSIANLAGKNINVYEIPFRQYSENFGFIQNETCAVVIPGKENQNLLDELSFGKLSVKRRLQKYCASLHRYELDEFMKVGLIKQLPGGVYVLTNSDYYDEYSGLDMHKEMNYCI
ncbi:MAG: CRISPR-associated helicase Cas3' [Clostridiales bacterium]|nr:CRISPR-associated helicase Cas3' [Clostridiales bacterium]